jgi:pyridoxal phosphate enzyme (YggS family)
MTQQAKSLPVSHDISTALNLVRDQNAKASRAAGRRPEDVTLIAVSKTHDAEAVLEALAAGQRHFGENRVQEAQAKFPDLKAAHPDLVLHLIGPLQTNKVKEAVALFDVIHTLDRVKLAEKLADEMAKQNRRPPCFIQVNTGREAQKAGIAPDDVGAFVAVCRDHLKLSVVGFMCIPPLADEPSPHFALLHDLSRRYGLAGLSMGMSGDAELAIKLGATHVRIGSAIFGQRKVFKESVES